MDEFKHDSSRLSDQSLHIIMYKKKFKDYYNERRKKLLIYVIFMIFIFVTVSIGTALTIQLIINSETQTSFIVSHLL